MLSNHSNSQFQINSNSNGNLNSDNAIDAPRHFVGSLNTRRIGKIHYIRLTKSNHGGFGIKIAERDNMFGTNRPIYITAITTTGSAYRDGRLKEGDMLLKINDQDLSGLPQSSVTKMLKEVPIGGSVEFVVSRQGDSTENSDNRFEEKVDDILNMPIVDGPGIFIFDIPLKASAGLGLYLKYPRNQLKQDLGIWIDKVLHGGAAWHDRRLQPNDQILAINGIELVTYSNSEATKILKAAVSRGIGPEARANTIRLKIHRRNPKLVASILYPTSNNAASSRSNSSSEGEGEFVRDSFARKSISEKRHSQSMGKNTRNYKKIQQQINNQNSQSEPNQMDDIEFLYYNLQLHYPPRPIPRSNSFIAAIDNNKLTSSSNNIESS